jgi:hypothetical protein
MMRPVAKILIQRGRGSDQTFADSIDQRTSIQQPFTKFINLSTQSRDVFCRA